MFWVPLSALLFVTWCTGANSQLTLSQPPSASVSLGNTMKISCAVSRNDRGIYWYQQKPENAPRFLLYYYTESSKGQGSGVPSRFTGSKDSSGSNHYLTISEAQAEDDGVYYCAGWYNNVYVFGGGTHLTVSGQPRVPPNVHVFGPSEEERKTKAKATITCLVDDFYPSDATVEWLVDGTPVSSGVETARPTRQGDKYVASSYLTLPVSEWEKHETYACKVTHGGEATEKSVRRSEYR